MKKVFTLILALAFGFGLKAQCPLTTAVDFTATDVHGTEGHLFDILDGGQYVLIDFFFTTCGPCQQATPKVVESYYAMGCNMHDVFYMEIATGDSEAACLNWVNTYGVEYPTISGEAGGTQICNQYQIPAYPTVILIMPDRSIVINDLWPINNAQTVIAALEQHGLEQHDCPTTGELVMSTDTVYIVNEGCYTVPGEITITNMSFEAVQIMEYTSEEFTIQCHEGDDPYYGNDIAGLFIAPSDSLHVYVSAYGMGENGLYMGTMRLITTIGDYEIAIIYEENVGMEESPSNLCSLFPNPANDFVTLKGESIGTVRVYNTLGQKMDEFEANGNELRISTAGYENGIYFVKAGEQTLKFVVKH